MSVLAVRALNAGRQGVAVVRGFDLSVEAGQIMALLGPNGAGKTTVLETISGVLPALGGTVEIGGKRVTSVQQAAGLGISYLREGRGLFTQLTVRENLFLRTRNRRAVEALLPDYPVLAPIADRQVGLLSGGEQQVLALACALCLNPKVLLIDEMTMGLAPIVVTQVLDRVRRAADAGIAVVVVEQHAQAALELADQGLVLRHGEVVMQGTSSELMERLGELHDSYFDLSLPA
jgi:branched-chain amino acid transport system ATP-binding protein